MARDPVRIQHGSGPPDLTGEEIVGSDGSLRFEDGVLTLRFARRFQPYEVVVPADGIASVVLGVQQRSKMFPFRVCVYDGDVYVVNVSEKQVRGFIRLAHALGAAGVKVTEETAQQTGGGGVGFFVGF
jgi:hypothetical protein